MKRQKKKKNVKVCKIKERKEIMDKGRKEGRKSTEEKLKRKKKRWLTNS